MLVKHRLLFHAPEVKITKIRMRVTHFWHQKSELLFTSGTLTVSPVCLKIGKDCLLFCKVFAET